MKKILDLDGNEWMRVKDYLPISNEKIQISYHIDCEGLVWIKREINQSSVVSLFGHIIPILEEIRQKKKKLQKF